MLAGYTSRSRSIVNTQKALGMDPVVLTSVRHQNDTGVAREELDGIRYYRSQAQRKVDRALVKEALEIHELRRRIVQVAKIEKPDLIHGHSSILCGIPAFLASRQLGLPCVYEIRAFWEDASVDHGTSVEGSPKYVAIQKAETLLARKADALIGICQGIKTELIHRGLDERSVFVIPNGVEVDRFVPRARDEALAQRLGLSGKTVVAYIGTFANFEGVPLLVKALIDLIKHGRDDLGGLIVGEGTTYDECRKLAEDARLSDRILHPGKVPHSEIDAMYSLVDILAYPRHSKRITELVTPLKPLEAMSMEKAVIGSGVGGLLELITDGETGLIHRADDVADLAAKICTLADDPELRRRLGRNGRAYVVRTRQWRRIIEDHFAVYDMARANWTKNQHLWRGLARMTT